MKARLVVTVRIKDGSEEDFLERYEAMHERVMQGIPGHIAHQLCRSVDDPQQFIITSEYDSVEESEAWDKSDEHRQLVMRLRECFESGASAKYEVVRESRH